MTFVLQLYKQAKSLSFSRKKIFEGYTESFNFVSGQKKNKQDINKFKENVCPRMLSYLNKVAILGGGNDTDPKVLKVELYQLKPEAYYLLWDPVLCSAHKFSSLQLDLNNAACASYHETVVVVSVVKRPSSPSSDIMLHLFTIKKTRGYHWRSASVELRHDDQSGRNNYKIQSCVVVDDNIFCSLVLHGVRAYIYKICLSPLKQCSTQVCKDSMNYYNWPIVKDHLQSCFLAVGPNKTVYTIYFHNEAANTIMTVNQLMQSFNVSRFEFPSIVKPIAATIIPNLVAIIYHDDKRNQCYAKKITIADS